MDEALEYDEFVRRKVAIARASAKAARTRSNEDVETDFAARRATALASSQV